MEPIKSPPRDPRGKVAQNMFVLPELRGGGDNTPSLKARIQRRTKHALSKLTRAAEATLKPAMTPEMRQHLAHKADMKRRQQAAEARAERVFADLARGVVFEDPLEVEKRKRKERPLTPIVMEYLDIRTNMDFLMPRREVLDVFLLPVIDESGLVVREVDEGRYERIGMFSQAAEVELRKLPWSKEPVEFLLV
ncbi:hypothetical protein QBC34DRAFT_401563 [Podospora aff. communis PSN243]|uniref:DNA replication factor Cdt1 C-terminal domain-containing protein n=1 Tax=Podospora aff. communis PSN243 TaxID=3040156 RepID=A0AAV9GU10_9PEZI|nr:hypothetical protein QBC34DRAFT_401563 [Podospora aff. communis PSN243]